MAEVAQNAFLVPLHLMCRKESLVQYDSIWGSREPVNGLRILQVCKDLRFLVVLHSFESSS